MQSIKQKLTYSSLAITLVVLTIVTASSLTLLSNQFSAMAQLLNERSLQFLHFLQTSSDEDQNTFADESLANLRRKAHFLAEKDALALEIALSENSVTFVREFISQTVKLDEDVVEGAFYVVSSDEKVNLWQFSTKAFLRGISINAVYDKEAAAWKFGKEALPDQSLDKILRIDDIHTSLVTLDGVQYIEVAKKIVSSENSDQGYLRYLLTTKNITAAIDRQKSRTESKLRKQELDEMETVKKLEVTKEKIKRSSNTVLSIVLVLAIAITISISFIIASRITKPLLILNESASIIASGNYDSQISIESGDEIGILAKNFDSMRTKVKEYTENLQGLVDERTKELALALSKTSAILNTIHQGIITVSGPELRVDPAMSLFTTEIFGTSKEEVAGKTIYELMIARSNLGGDHKAVIYQTLQAAMGEDMLTWELNNVQLPRSLVVDVAGKDRYLEVEWSPMLDEHMNIARILVAIRDLTEIKIREENFRKEIEANQKIIERIAAVVTNSKESVLLFMYDVKRRIINIGELFQDIEIRHKKDILHELHTIKGQARTLKLSDIANASHMAEDLIKQEAPTDEINQQMTRITEIFEEYYSVVSDKIGWLDPTSKMDLFSTVAKELTHFYNALTQRAIPVKKIALEDNVICWNDKALTDIKAIVTVAVANSIDHGYLDPLEHNKKVGDGYLKIETGTDGDSAYIEILDGGCGYDIDRIVSKAKELNLDLKQFENVLDVVLLSEFSTASRLTISSGRGVGMSIIGEIAKSYGGSVQLSNRPMYGASVKVIFPKKMVLYGPVKEHLLAS